MRQRIVKTILFFVLSTCLISCYRMPTEDDYCLIPSTNNPDLTREGNAGILPGVNY
jgi:hypothetical protein